MNFQYVWAEINLSNIAHNIRELRRITAPGSRLMAVVKANGYGHGAVEVGRVALKNGAELLGVARLDEAIELRKSGIKSPIIVLGYTPYQFVEKLIKFDIIPVVYNYENAKALSETAKHLNKKIKIHLKVDTGMGRLGICPEEVNITALGKHISENALKTVQKISLLERIELEGVFTHFATADSMDKSFVKIQLERFQKFIIQLKKIGLNPPFKHAANSAAIIDMPQTHLDMVRAGISIYGFYPSSEVNKNEIALKPAMALKTRIIHLKRVPANFKISYGLTYKTPKPTTIATVSIGYADGLNRLLSSNGHMIVRGRKAPIVGRICMDLTMIDVGDIPDVNMYDEVVIFGKQKNTSITVDELAESLSTINYEIVSTITARVPRIYIE